MKKNRLIRLKQYRSVLFINSNISEKFLFFYCDSVSYRMFAYEY